MDPKERHELKDNDLAEFLENFGDFWGKHGNTIMIVAIAVMAVWFGTRYYRNTVAVGHDNAWADLAATSTPGGFRERAAENAGYGGVPHIALLRGAEAYHQQAIKLMQDQAGEEDAGVMSAEESLDAAEAMYNQLLTSDAQAPYRANAALGLANLAETRGDFDAAAKHWDSAKTIADEANLVTITALTDLRIAMLDDLQRPIIFGESDDDASDAPTEAVPEPTDTPAEEIAPDAEAQTGEPAVTNDAAAATTDNADPAPSP